MSILTPCVSPPPAADKAPAGPWPAKSGGGLGGNLQPLGKPSGSGSGTQPAIFSRPEASPQFHDDLISDDLLLELDVDAVVAQRNGAAAQQRPQQDQQQGQRPASSAGASGSFGAGGGGGSFGGGGAGGGGQGQGQFQFQPPPPRPPAQQQQQQQGSFPSTSGTQQPQPPQQQFSRKQRGVCPIPGASPDTWRCCHDVILRGCPDPALHLDALRADLAEARELLGRTPRDTDEYDALEVKCAWAPRMIQVRERERRGEAMSALMRTSLLLLRAGFTRA